jgi:hypothetical protein
MRGKGKKQLEQKCGGDAAEIMLVHRHLHHRHHHHPSHTTAATTTSATSVGTAAS